MRLNDIALSDIQETVYDVAVFATGYESRSTHLARQLTRESIAHPALIGFRELERSPSRIRNDEYYDAHWNLKARVMSTNDDGGVLSSLEGIGAEQGVARVLVDYSSMSRLWYAMILNWARFVPIEVIVDLVYSSGTHDEVLDPMMIDKISAIPGCEGSFFQGLPTVAVFGLGFDGHAVLSVLERLQPDIVYGFYAEPGATKDCAARARDLNREFIEADAESTLGIPLASVETGFRKLAEVIGSHRESANVLIFPMGPKPHVLASMLVSFSFGTVSCVRASGVRDRPEDVTPTGECVCTRVVFDRQGKVK